MFKNQSIHILAWFRIIFGLLCAIEINLYYFKYSFFDAFYLEPNFHFKYYGFAWVPNVSPSTFKVILFICSASFLLVSAGLFYRISAWISFISFSWIFFMESSSYLNHWYFIVLLSFLILWMPLNHSFSLDKKFGLRSVSASMEPWHIYILCLQTSLMLFFSGTIKLNDDWLSGNTMLVFFSYFENNPLVNIYYSILGKNTSLIISWTTVLLEIILPFLLWFKKTRSFAAILLSLFLLQNAYLLQIGVFPYLSILCILLFFFIPSIKPFQQYKIERFTRILFYIYFLIQMLLPLRVYFHRDYIWQGTQASFFAWNMFLTMPEGHISYKICKNNVCNEIDPINYGISLYQKKKMISNPYHIFQFGKMLCKTNPKAKVFAKSYLSVNKRPLSPYFKGNINICACRSWSSSEIFLNKYP